MTNTRKHTTLYKGQTDAEGRYTMNIYIDADASPVQNEVFQIATDFNLSVVMVKSFSHFSSNPLPDHVSVKYVDKGAEMADYKIMALVNKGDIVITQDYGLASVLLGKGSYVLHHKGFQYTEENIDPLLSSRHASALARRAGHRTKGPKAFTTEDREKFSAALTNLIEQIKL